MHSARPPSALSRYAGIFAATSSCARARAAAHTRRRFLLDRRDDRVEAHVESIAKRICNLPKAARENNVRAAKLEAVVKVPVTHARRVDRCTNAVFKVGHMPPVQQLAHGAQLQQRRAALARRSGRSGRRSGQL